MDARRCLTIIPLVGWYLPSPPLPDFQTTGGAQGVVIRVLIEQAKQKVCLPSGT